MGGTPGGGGVRGQGRAGGRLGCESSEGWGQLWRGWTRDGGKFIDGLRRG